MERPVERGSTTGSQLFEHELTMARFSRIVYDSHEEITRGRDAGGEYKFPEGWAQVRGSNGFIDANQESGLVTASFVDDKRKQVIIAFRGTDNLKDLVGPDLALIADGQLAKEVGIPVRSDRVQGQTEELQKRAMPDWDHQFAQALDYTGAIARKYEALGYQVQVTGHGLGGSLAQVASQVYDLRGSAFDPAGAANVLASDGFARWAQAHAQDDARVRAWAKGGQQPWHEGFTNYTVNNSAFAHKSGPHLGQTIAISGFTGRQGAIDYARYFAGMAADVSADTLDALPPLLDRSAMIPRAIKRGAEALETGGALSKRGDISDRAGMERIERLFEQAVQTQKLPRWGRDVSSPSANALAAAGSAEPVPSRPDMPGHPDHQRYLSVRNQVHALDASLERQPDAASERMVGSLLLLAKQHGLQRIDHVLLNTETAQHPAGSLVFAVQGELRDPGHHRAQLPTQVAVATPVEQSFAQIEALNRQPSQAPSQHVPELAMQQAASQAAEPAPARRL